MLMFHILGWATIWGCSVALFFMPMWLTYRWIFPEPTPVTSSTPAGMVLVPLPQFTDMCRLMEPDTEEDFTLLSDMRELRDQHTHARGI